MGYQTIKDYFVRRLGNYKFFESPVKFDFTREGDDFDGKFIFENNTSEQERETINTEYHFDRIVNVKLAKRYGEKTQTRDYDEFMNVIDLIIADIPNPANYQSDSIVLVRLDEITIEDISDYYQANVSFIVEDRITYA